LIASSFGEPKIEPVVRWLSLAFLLIALQSVQDAILRRNMAFKSLAFRSLVATFTSGVVSVTLAFMGFGVWSLVAQQLINRIVHVLMLWRASSWRPGLAVSFGCLKDLLSFSVYVMGTNFLRFFNQRSDDFLIGYFLGSVTLGYYTVAYKFLLLMVNIFTNSTTTVALPAFSKLQEDSERLRKAFYKATQLTSFISFPSFSIILVIAPELVHVMFGEKWDASIPVMQVLILAGILQSVSYFGGTVMLAKGKPNLRLGMHCLNAVTNVIGFMIAVNHGIVAVAIAFVISNYLIAPVNLIIIKRLIKISYADYFRQYTGPVLSSLFMVLIVFFVRNSLIEFTTPFLTLSTCCIAGAISYLSAIALLDRSLANQVFKLAKQFL
ncbi:MAG: lipopolysaccharide biosynthesis protein, partial [Leptolyngbya sp. SIO3F4]|nr:lipopolysaccharide biosynthesis protein [Leptolyngbya sp. SIO3F4]